MREGKREPRRGRVDRVERHTVERFDRDALMVRVEIVPLKKEISPREFEELLTDGMEKEDLSWWDLDGVTTKRITVKGLRRRLGLGHDQEVAENMVFWVFKRGREILRVRHASQPARQLAKEIYTRLIGPESLPPTHGGASSAARRRSR